MSQLPQSESPPQVQLRKMITSYWLSQAIYVAARLNLADHLKAGPRAASDLARITGTHGRSLYRLMRALASVGIFAEEDEKKFSLTPLATCLRSDVPGSQRAAALMMGDENYFAWAELLNCIQTGKTAFDQRYGKPLFEYLAERPEAAEIFDAAMTGIHGPETGAMLEVHDFSSVETLVDVGGGNGSVMKEILNRYPSLKGILLDRLDVAERTEKRLEEWGLADRCQVVGGDFFESVPAGGDLYLLRHVIHDWDDEKAQTILTNIRKVMPAESRLLVIEAILPPGNEPGFAKFVDLNMLVIPGGQERTEKEYIDLFQASGFRLTQITPTRLEVSLIEGEPIVSS